MAEIKWRETANSFIMKQANRHDGWLAIVLGAKVFCGLEASHLKSGNVAALQIYCKNNVTYFIVVVHPVFLTTALHLAL